MRKTKRRSTTKHSRNSAKVSKPNPVWRKVPRTVGLYEFKASGTYFANIRHGDKLYRESLKTSDLSFAKRKLHDFKQRLQRTDPRFGKISFVAWLKGVYLPTLKGSANTLGRIVARSHHHSLNHFGVSAICALPAKQGSTVHW